MRWAGFLVIGACVDGPTLPAHPCHADMDWEVDIAAPRGSFGEVDLLWSGIPPQGGAPYTPIRPRVRGPDVLFDGMGLEVLLSDADTGEELSVTDLDTRMTCANVGESAGYWVGSELHLRYPGVDLADLEDRDVTLSMRVTSIDQTAVIEDEWLVTLVLE